MALKCLTVGRSNTSSICEIRNNPIYHISSYQLGSCFFAKIVYICIFFEASIV